MPASTATTELHGSRLATDYAAALQPRAATTIAGYAPRRASPALPMSATQCSAQPEHRDSLQLPNARRFERDAVEPTQRLVAKPMRRAHRLLSAAPSACQHCHVRSPGQPATATSRRHLQEELLQRKRLATAAPRRTPRGTMLVDARNTPNQDAQRLQRSTRMRADASITVVEGDSHQML